ncbi:type II CAAX prenyl endopeptidase Rce1 family protein [Flavobacterium sp. ZS1P14]|uniref:CPBP family glutamic-type intramembrane protease n=1 Tax=Flavobacterium sp. ZS1P14 TaxID=3401729 RepID=UPI003AAFF0D0
MTETNNKNTNKVRKRSLPNFLLLLFVLSAPCWVFGAIYDVQIFPGFKLFQLPLAMPMVAALILIHRESGKTGVIALLKRTYDFRNIKSKIWYLPIVFLSPSIGFLDYWIICLSGTSIPSPHFSFFTFLGYSTVFFMTFGEELGLTGYATDPMQQRYSALKSGIILGLVWAGYHIPGFVISGYYSSEWILWHALYTVATRVLFVWVYNNSGKSLFSMALFHWAFGLFWSLWPQDNLQRAVPFYDPRICALLAVFYVSVVVFLWGPKTLAKYRYARFRNTER